MKSFLKFLSESAAQQAARLGLQGDGHGGWYDKTTGEFVAKTEKGTLKFYNKRQKIGGKDPAQTEKEKNISDPNFVDPNLQQEPVQQEPVPQSAAEPAAQEPEQPVGPPPVEKTKGTLTVAFGRFNPPTIGHQQLMDVAAQAASGDDGGEYLIFPSRSQDKKKNPLDPDTKIQYMQKFYPAHADRIMNDANTRTIFDVLKMAHNDGYTNVRIVGGSDRVKEFEKLSNNYNGQLYAFDNIEVLSSGERDPDAKGVEGMSASRMRLAAAEGDFKTFRSGMPPDMKPKDARAIFDMVRMSMGIKDGVAESWQIAPKFNYQVLRENYVNHNIFKIGQLVENLNTGLVGRIIRRGTNYLICVTEDKIMFKSWIKDVTEAVVNGTTRSGVGAENRLVGTDKFRKYVESMVPGSVCGYDFINKNKKRKK